MSKSKMKMVAVAASFLATASLQAHAEVAAYASNSGTGEYGRVHVGETQPGFHGTGGQAGIGFEPIYSGQPISFSGIASSYAPADGNGVSTMGVMSDNEVFDFAKVTGQEVYFGEYINGDSVSPVPLQTRTVYYAGENPTKSGDTLIPASATYNVVGLNNYDYDTPDATTLLNGTLNANFTNSKLSGTLTRGVAGSASAVTNTLTITNASISTDASNNVTFGGTGVANANGIATGDVKGNFFGNGATALAGVATFGTNKQYDTAFGGKR